MLYKIVILSTMDNLIFSMDILINHWRPFPRLTPSRFRVVSMGAAHKTPAHQVRNTFDTLNFSFIRRGGGKYRRGDEIWRVEAPAVLMQWPGEPVCYGPDVPDGFVGPGPGCIRCRPAAILFNAG